MEELRSFWKERLATLLTLFLGISRNDVVSRSIIEEDYGKRLSKLAKATLGRDEIGCAYLVSLLPGPWRV